MCLRTGRSGGRGGGGRAHGSRPDPTPGRGERAGVGPAEGRSAITGQAREEAQRTYRRALAAAAGPTEERAAITVWMRDIDQLNRDSQTARVALEAAGVEVAEAHGALTAASLAANTERIRAEGAADRCQATRRQLAECVEGSAGRSQPMRPTGHSFLRRPDHPLTTGRGVPGGSWSSSDCERRPPVAA